MIINANALSIPLADKSVHCIVTSPPYWALRNYGVAGQLGLEKTPEEYIANMVSVFRECWRVLRDDGTLWLNIGDSYAGGSKDANPNGKQGTNYGTVTFNNKDHRFYVPSGLKPKDLVGIPWRLAFALQADGWYLRSDIIWAKPNPMPESVTDRPTKSHEYIFLLTKRERYFYDAEAVREKVGEPTRRQKTFRGGIYTNNTSYDNSYDYSGHDPFSDDEPSLSGRNNRSVWTIPTAPYKGAHFATFPPALVEPCIKAGTSERGVCPKCGAPWARVVEKIGSMRIREGSNTSGGSKIRTAQGGKKVIGIFETGEKSIYETLGFRPSCKCEAGEPIPALVFDPFVGSGTTVKVAYDLGRRGVGLDLSLQYLDEQATTRIHNGHVGRLI